MLRVYDVYVRDCQGNVLGKAEDVQAENRQVALKRGAHVLSMAANWGGRIWRWYMSVWFPYEHQSDLCGEVVQNLGPVDC